MAKYKPFTGYPDGMYYANRIARKEYPCSLRKGCVIKPGDEYTDELHAPWLLVADDVDDDGRPTGAPLGEWVHIRSHRSHPLERVDFDKSPVMTAIRERQANAYPESQRMGGGDPMADYLHAKGEL